jgi:hypothetical protein
MQKRQNLFASGGVPAKPDEGRSALLLRRLPVPEEHQSEEAGLSRDLGAGGRGGGGTGSSFHRPAGPGYHQLQVLAAALPAGSALCCSGAAQADSRGDAIDGACVDASLIALQSRDQKRGRRR